MGCRLLGLVARLFHSGIYPASCRKSLRLSVAEIWRDVGLGGRPEAVSLAHFATPAHRTGDAAAPRRCNPTSGDPPQRDPSAEGRQASEKVSMFASTFF